MTPIPTSRLIAAILGLLAAVSIVGWVARVPVTTFSTAVLTRTGLPGLFALVVVTDPLPGVGFQPALFVGWTGGLDAAVVSIVVFLGSLTGSALGWLLGRVSARSVLGPLEQYGIAAMILRHRWRAVALAAVTPLPFGVATLGAGALGLSFGETMAGASLRGIKIAVILGLFALGWGER